MLFLACKALNFVVASRFERLFNSCVISLSNAPVKTGADAALPFASASAGAELPTGAAMGVAPENLHAQQELHAGTEADAVRLLQSWCGMVCT